MFLRRLLFVAALLALVIGLVVPLSAQRTGDLKQRVFAIRNARVVTEPGKILPEATIVIRDGLIDAVGADAKAPPEALVMDGKGLTVYAGFIDATSNWGFDPALRRSEAGAPATEDLAAEALAATKPDNRKGMTPEFQVATALKAEDDLADNWRRAGFTAHLIAPDGGTIVGQSALVSLSTAPPRDATLRSPFAMHVAFKTIGSNDYPRALMGIVAHTRQTLLDAAYYQRTWAAYEKSGRAGKRPPLDPSLADLGPVLEGKMPVVFEADSKDGIHRALDFAGEFNLKPILFGGSDAWKAVDRLKETKTPLIVRLNFSDGSARPRRRPGGGPAPATPPAPGTNPRRNPGGNAPAAPAAADPTTPEEPERDLPRRAKEDQQRREKEEIRNAGVLQKEGILFALSTQGLTGDKPWDKFRENLRKAIAEGLSPDAALKALTVDAAHILGIEKQLGTIEKGKAAHLVVMDGDFQEAKTNVRYVFADGERFEYDVKKEDVRPAGGRGASRTDEKKPDDRTPDEKKEVNQPDGKKSNDKKDETKPDDKKPDEKPANETATELEADRKPKLHTGGNVLIRNATVLTVTNGTKEKTDILVRGGKIAEIGQGLKAADGVSVIEADGLFVMPGIIDTHCHFAVEGGVNEFSLSVVPEVRVRDVINSDDVEIYRALGGGVTTARLLHGSANVIGGQDAVIKLKYGEPASKLLIADAPRGVKFALGENVKRTDGRFPNTRLGVEAVLIRAFTEAQEYQKAQREYALQKSEGKNPPEPRRDLRLEALADVLKGDLKVHCHCYRSDEILMLLRVADRFGFKVKSLQHVLEGYKIASEIADHGASCSTFSDWWAYKIEAYDAVPFNSALLAEAGADVCLKSDSNELTRHLYQEAAKCIKYGGMSETETLKAITLNGAKQLGLDKRLGSIEVGKDADLAIFNGHPLNSYARVDMTLVEGEVYFQRPGQSIAFKEAKVGPTPSKKEFKAIPASAKGTYTLDNVTVHSGNGETIAKARVMVKDGKVNAVSELKNGDAALQPQNGEVVVDASGLHLYPGMIDAATVLGLTELGSARETQDFAEGGDFQPDLKASTAINPDSELIPVTRANGVLSVVTRPMGSIIAGQSALINLHGWTPKEMAVVDPLTLNIEFPSINPTFTGDPTLPMIGRAIAKKQREEKLRRLKELFAQAIIYDDARKVSAETPANPRLEALVPYAHGKKSVVIQANRKPEILEALKLADELKIKIIISGGVDAWKVTEELKKQDVSVIVGPIMTMPQESYDPYDAPYACPAKLHEAGIKFCIRSAGSTNTRNLPYEAAMAVSYGLPAEEGLKSVTLYPAQILGVSDQLGSIETGKRANLVLTDGDILQASTQVKALFIDGKPLEPTSKQTRLYERYRERLKEVKDGRSPLGTK